MRGLAVPSCAGLCMQASGAVSCVFREGCNRGFKRRLRTEGGPWRIYTGARGSRRRAGGTTMGGARMAFCGQFSMCLYAVMCYRFPPEPCCLRAYTYIRTVYAHATRYSYLYFQLCEINPLSRSCERDRVGGERESFSLFSEVFYFFLLLLRHLSTPVSSLSLLAQLLYTACSASLDAPHNPVHLNGFRIQGRRLLSL